MPTENSCFARPLASVLDGAAVERPRAAAVAVRRFESVLDYALWPAILAACLTGTGIGIALGRPAIGFNLTYVALALVLFALERVRPHERRWLVNDGQMPADFAHTALNKGAAQLIVVSAVAAGIPELAAAHGSGLWPSSWPMILQATLGLVIAEIGLYAAHRVSHEWRMLWRFHAVHHSAPRLWFFNTGRFHFADTAISIVLSQPLLFLVGAPSEVFVWVVAFTAFVGMLTHCNVRMRFGVLSYVFNTPELHRWHHSRDPRQGNANYGENLMLFDLALGTFLLPAGRPPVNPGIADAMPRNFVGQLLAPFRAWREQPGV